jgi:enoyl-[acyl-carrier-protein] reductase (NADH)
MEVNFNNLRKQAVFSLDRLTKALNNAMDKETGQIEIHANDIEKEMGNLRMLVRSIAFVYEPGDDRFKDLSDEIGKGEEFNSFED